MDKRLSSRAMLGFSMSLVLLPFSAWADFIIEFTDGRQVTVSRYVDEGQTIKIYAPQGAIGFRKDNVRRITEVGANQSINTPLETVSIQSALPAPASTLDPSHGKEKADLGIATEAGKGKTAEAGKATEAEREHLEARYQDIAQQFDKIWEKHLQDVNSGASEEVLAENRRRLTELDQERRKLIEHASRRVNPDDLPAWAQ